MPDGEDCVRVRDQPSLGSGGQGFGESLSLVGQWPAAVSAGGCAVGGGLMKSRQEGGQGFGRVCGTRDRGLVGGCARYPGGDGLWSREPFAGLAESLRDGDWQREPRGHGSTIRLSLEEDRKHSCLVTT